MAQRPDFTGILANVQQEGRPDLEELYTRLADITRKPLDLSPLKAVAAANQEGSRRDFLGGLALSTLGGKRMSPLGKALGEAGIERGKPLRPNAADIAYENPDTGEIVANPYIQHNQDIKATEAAIKSVEGGQAKELAAATTLARELGAAGRAEEANALRLTIAQMASGDRAAGRALSATLAMMRAAGMPKPTALSGPEKKSISELNSRISDVDFLLPTFKDKYAGKGAVGRLQVTGESMLGDWAPQESQDRAAWWSNFKMMRELPERHALFGSALTATEKASWQEAQLINPNTDPKRVRATLAKMQETAKNVRSRLVEQLRAENRILTPDFTGVENVPAPRGAAPQVAVPPVANDGWTEVAPGVRIREKVR